MSNDSTHLIDDQDWQFDIYRLKIQNSSIKFNHQQIVPWYKFLMHQNDELDKALSATRVPNSSKTAIKAWIELNKPETRTPENDLYTTIDESYSPTKITYPRISHHQQILNTTTQFQNCNLQKGGTNTTGLDRKTRY